MSEHSCPWSSSSKTTATRSPFPVEAQTPGGSISRLVESFPEPARRPLRRHGCPRELPRDDGCGAVVPRASRARARARDRDRVRTRIRTRTMSGPTRRRRSAPRKPARDPITQFAAFLVEHDIVDRGASWPRSRHDVDREIDEAADAAFARRSRDRNTAGLYVYSPDVDPDRLVVRYARPRRKASPTRWSRPSTGR